MNTNLLKQKILDLAIRGKLTQQLKSDGTAADLLTQISDERRKTRDERKGTRSKKSGVILSEAQSAKSKDPGAIIPLDKSEAPFEIPANWEWVRLGDVASDFQYGSAEKSQVEGKVAVLRMGNINRQGQIDYGDLVYTSNDAEIAKYLLNKNDVLFNRTNSPEWVGKTAIYKGEIPAIYAGYIIRIRPHFNSDYLNYLMCSDYERNWSKEVKTDGVHQSNINAQKLIAFAIPLPPLAEQQRIVAKIEEAFAEIDAIEKNKELLKTHIKQTRQKILDLAIHGKLVPQNKSDEPASVLLERITRDNPHYEKLTDVPFEIPASWEWVKYAELVTNISVKNFQVKSSEIQPIGTFPVVSQGQSNIDGFVDDPKKVVHLRFPIVLFGDHTKIVKYIDFDFVVGADGTKVLEAKSAINPKYLYFMTLNIVEKIEDRGYGRHFALLSNSLCPLPPLAEQKRIVDRIEEIFASLDEISLHLV